MATVVDRKNSDGEIIGYQFKIRRKGFPVQSKTFTRKSDGEKWARKVESEMDAGAFIDRGAAEDTTVKQLVERYLKEVTPKRKGARQEELRLNAFLRYRLCGFSAAKVSKVDFQQWRDARLKEVGPGTVIRELNLWHAVFAHAASEWGIRIHENPASVKRPPQPAWRDRRLDPAPDENGLTEEARLLAAAEASSDKLMASIIRLAISTAMRQGEILALEWPDVDFDSGTLRIRNSKTDSARRDGVRGRTIPLVGRAVAVLKALAGEKKPAGGLVFPLDANSFKMRFRRLCEKAGITGLTFHDLRHEGTSRLFEAGLAMMEVASITGHQTLSMLQRYTHLHAKFLAEKLRSRTLEEL